MQVRRYDLGIDVNFEKSKFKGKVAIQLESDQNVVLNAAGLDIQSVGSSGKNLRFKQADEDLIVETGSFDGRLDISYDGSITDSLAGVYRAPYDGTYIVTTHFEAAQARRMLPCVDRPDVKAVFKLTLTIPKDLDAISNMPVESMDITGSRKTVTFRETPRMSTYLLYLGVGKFEEQTATLPKTDLILATTPR